MAKPLDEILKSYSWIYYDTKNIPRQKPSAYVKGAMPRFLQTDENKPYYDFLDKLFQQELKMEFWVWVLQGQFSILTARGKFLDNLGRWLGLARPPLPVKRTNEPVVIYPPKYDKSGMTPQEYKEFNELHGLTDYYGNGVKNTFYPSRDFIGETLVNDKEYRLYIQSMLRLRMGVSLPVVIDVLTKILVKPFFITKHDADVLEITASYYEDAVRLVIVREMTAKLRTTGFNIEVLQATEIEPSEITQKYGAGCWEQKNPYITESDEELS